MRNPYDCSGCDNEESGGCSEAYENGYIEGRRELAEWVNKRSSEDFYISIPQGEWQAKLKELGIV